MRLEKLRGTGCIVVAALTILHPEDGVCIFGRNFGIAAHFRKTG